MGHNKVLIGLLAVDANSELGYPRYFAMSPTGPDPNPAWSRGFFNAAMAQNPKPRSWGVLAADYAYCKDVTSGARANAKSAGLSLLYDRTFPLRNLDFFTHIAALSAAKADIVFVCAAGADAINFIHQFTQKGLAPKMIGGVMVGLQATSDKMQLGDALNGWVLYDFWLPAPALEFAGTSDFVRKYQARAAAEGADPLGYYVAPWAYAQLQVLGQAVAATKSVDDAKLADYIRASTFKTVVGDVKFGAKGEWAEPRVLQVQFQNIKGNTIDQFRDTKSQVVVDPPAYKSGSMIYPFVDARK
jgi:branched-chain amino acid transport system substrate-binding protein